MDKEEHRYFSVFLPICVNEQRCPPITANPGIRGDRLGRFHKTQLMDFLEKLVAISSRSRPAGLLC